MREGRSRELTGRTTSVHVETAAGRGMDRWFGMYRSVGTGAITANLFHEVVRQRRRHVGQMVGVAALLVAGMAALTWWDRPAPGAFGSELASLLGNLWFLFVASLWPSANVTWRLFAMKADGVVEHFEGRAPRVQGHRDKQTEKLVEDGAVQVARTHRLTVDPVTNMLLAVDGTPVKARRGRIVGIAAPVVDAEEARAPGRRRPLTPMELQELDGLTRWQTRRDRLMAAGFVAVGVLTSACLLSGDSAWTVRTWLTAATPLSCIVGLAGWILVSRDRSWQYQMDTAKAQGVVLGSRVARLEPLNLVWERDGLPSFERLERGRAAVDAGRSRPTTF